jgi:hypothetical protein
MHSRQPLHEAIAEVKAALTAIGMEHRTDFVIFRDTHEETDVVVLFTLNTKLLAFLLVSCPNFGSVGSAMLRPGFSLIRELSPKSAGSDGVRKDVEMRTEVHDGRAAVPSSSAWQTILHVQVAVQLEAWASSAGNLFCPSTSSNACRATLSFSVTRTGLDHLQSSASHIIVCTLITIR